MKELNKSEQYFLEELDIWHKHIGNEHLLIDDYIDVIKNIITIFDSQGHSGTSAAVYSATLRYSIYRMLTHKLLCTNEDDLKELLFDNNNMSNTEYFEKEYTLLFKKYGNDLIIAKYINPLRMILKIFNSKYYTNDEIEENALSISNSIYSILMFEPLVPIFGTDDEWVDLHYSEDLGFQNKRCSSIFKHSKSGISYYLNAIIFHGEDKYDSFTGSMCGITSNQNIKSFPFVPKSFRIHVRREPYDKNNPLHHGNNVEIISCGSHGDQAYFFKDLNEVLKVGEYYDLNDRTKLALKRMGVNI